MTENYDTDAALDFRTAEEIEDAADALVEDARTFVTGFPARPGTIR